MLENKRSGGGTTTANIIQMIILLACAGLILVFILKSTQPLFHDEAYHLNETGAIKYYGWGSQMMKHLQAGPGPLFPAIQYLLTPLTGLQVPWVRLVSWVSAMATMLLLGKAIATGNNEREWWEGFTLLAFPSAWFAASMVVSNMPPLIFLGLALWCTSLLLRGSPGSARSILLALVAGIAFALSVLGRQPMMLVVPFFALELFLRAFRKEALLVGILGWLPVPYMYLSWGGLRPPFNDVAGGTGTLNPHLNLDGAMTLVGLLLVFALVIHPSVLKRCRWWMLGVLLITAAVCYAGAWVEYLPMQYVLRDLGLGMDTATWARLFGAGLFATVIVGCIVFWPLAWEGRKKPLVWAALGAALLHAVGLSFVTVSGIYILPSAMLILFALYTAEGQRGWLKMAQWPVLIVSGISIFNMLFLHTRTDGLVYPNQTIYFPELFERFPQYKGWKQPPVLAEEILEFENGALRVHP